MFNIFPRGFCCMNANIPQSQFPKKLTDLLGFFFMMKVLQARSKISLSRVPLPPCLAKSFPHGYNLMR